MRVAWFGHVAGKRGNGLVTYSRDITDGLRRSGLDVLFFYHGGSESDQQRTDFIRIGSLDLFDRTVISSIDAPRVIADALRRERAEIAHASLSWSLLDFALPDVCHDAGVPIVCTLHFPYDAHQTIMGGLSRTLYWVYANILGRFDSVIIFSEQQKRMLTSMGIAAEKIVVIPNGVDIVAFSPGSSTYKAAIEAETLITFLGRLDPEKNVGVLCECFQRIEPPPGVKLAIVGGGSEAPLLRQRFGSDPRIIFTGVIADRAERINILRASDIFVLPSRVEGLSIAMLEAMACGIATIATDVGSDGEALRGAGMVVSTESLPAQLCLALETLLLHAGFRRSLGKLARQRARERFSLNDNIKKVVTLYDAVLGSAQKGA